MELAQLRYLVAVDEERSFTRAAQRCFVTQQSLSAGIARLERTVGTVLVERTTRTVALTPAGAAFVVRARRALAEVDAAAADARAVAEGVRGRVRLGFHGPGADLLAPMLDRVRARLPELRIELRRVDFTDPTAGVLADRSDVGLVAAPLRHAELAAVPVQREPMVVVLAEDHPLAAHATLSIGDLLHWPVARMPNPRNDPLRTQWNDFWTLQSLPQPPQPTPVEFEGVEEWLAAHRHQQWFSTGPESAARLYPAAGVVWRPCSGLPTCTWRLYRRRVDRRAVVQTFLGAVSSAQ